MRSRPTHLAKTAQNDWRHVGRPQVAMHSQLRHFLVENFCAKISSHIWKKLPCSSRHDDFIALDVRSFRRYNGYSAPVQAPVSDRIAYTRITCSGNERNISQCSLRSGSRCYGGRKTVSGIVCNTGLRVVILRNYNL